MPRYLLSDWNTAGSDQKKRDLQFNVGCLLLSSQPQYSSEKKQMENFQTVTFSRYMKHQVKGHLLDPSNFSTKMGKKTSKHSNRDVGGQKQQQQKQHMWKSIQIALKGWGLKINAMCQNIKG